MAKIKVAKKAMVIESKASPVLKLAGKYRCIKPLKLIDVEKIRQDIDYYRL